MISLGGFYKAKMWSLSGRLGIHSWNLNYEQKLDKHFTLMTSLDGNLMQVMFPVGFFADNNYETLMYIFNGPHEKCWHITHSNKPGVAYTCMLVKVMLKLAT